MYFVQQKDFMKLQFRFYASVICIGVLVWSTPFAVSAQQDTDTIVFQATIDAKKDVSYDHSKIQQMILGAGIPLIGCCVGLTAGCLFGEETSGGIYGPSRSIDPYAFFGGLALTTAVGYAVLYSYNSEPPAFRLLGKSPQYVEVYTDVYIKKLRMQRMMWSAIGSSVWVISIPSLILEGEDLF